LLPKTPKPLKPRIAILQVNKKFYFKNIKIC